MIYLCDYTYVVYYIYNVTKIGKITYWMIILHVLYLLSVFYGVDFGNDFRRVNLIHLITC